MNKQNAIGLAALGLALAGCDDVHVTIGQQDVLGEHVNGSGRLKSETRPIGNFHAVNAGSCVHVQLEVGPEPSFKIEAEDNLLSRIKSEVRSDGTLKIWSRGINPSKEIRITLTTPKIDALDISGASEMAAKGVSASKLALNCSGASRLDLYGTGDNVSVDFSGASQAHLFGIHAKTLSGEINGASNLTAEGAIDAINLTVSGAGQADLAKAPGSKAKVDLSGASNMTVIALDGIDAEVSGSSNLRYKANRDVHVSTSGVGSAHSMN